MTRRVPWPVADGFVAEGGRSHGLKWQITRRASPAFVRLEVYPEALHLVPEQSILRVSAVGSDAVRAYAIDGEKVRVPIDRDGDLLTVADMVMRGQSWLLGAAIARARKKP